jgi:hypothetical protein
MNASLFEDSSSSEEERVGSQQLNATRKRTIDFDDEDGLSSSSSGDDEKPSETEKNKVEATTATTEGQVIDMAKSSSRRWHVLSRDTCAGGVSWVLVVGDCTPADRGRKPRVIVDSILVLASKSQMTCTACSRTQRRDRLLLSTISNSCPIALVAPRTPNAQACELFGV